MTDSEIKTVKPISMCEFSNNAEDQKIAKTRADAQFAMFFLTNTLKNYKLFKQSPELYRDTYYECDMCKGIRRKDWDGMKFILDVLRFDYDGFPNYQLCLDCYNEKLEEEEKGCYLKVPFVRNEFGVLIEPLDKSV